MESNKSYIPYIITLYGVLETDKLSIEEMKGELAETNIQYLITKADSKFVEMNEDELKNNKKISKREEN